MIRFTIPIDPVTKKNSQQIMINNKTGKRYVAPSKQYKLYESQSGWFVPRPAKPIDIPVNIECKFYLGTRRRADLTNLLEAIDDILVKYGVIADDNYLIAAAHDGSRAYYDKANPRTEIHITRLEA